MNRISNLFIKLVWAFLTLMLCLSIPTTLNAQSQPLLLKDTNDTPLGSHSMIRNFTALGQQTLFLADDGDHGIELWKTDGTEAGTVLVKDINPGPSDSTLPYGPFIYNVNGMVLFIVYNNFSDVNKPYEIWKTDGTEAGTVLVKKIPGYIPSSYPTSANGFPSANGFLFFRTQQKSSEGFFDYQLWKSDGTESGTSVVYSNGNNSNGHNEIYGLTTVNNTLFFLAKNSSENIPELWKTDGTETGTAKIIDFGLGDQIDHLTNCNGTLFFIIQQYDSDGNSLSSLWKSDGTMNGTVKVKDINHLEPQRMIALNNTLFIVSNLFIQGVGNIIELWKSDGTEVGTVKVKDIYPEFERVSVDDLTATSSQLFFIVTVSMPDNTHKNILWKSDGTETGTGPVKEGIEPSHLNGYLGPRYYASVSDTIFFQANDQVHGRELWKSDGTEAGTILIKDIFPGSGDSMPLTIENVNGTIYFRAHDPVHGNELWKTDGTEIGTVLVKDIFHGSTGTYPSQYVQLNDELFFTARNFSPDKLYVQQIWKSNGKEAGTVLVTEFHPGPESIYIQKLNAVNDALLFFITINKPEGTKYELWKTNGTGFGTSLVEEMSPELFNVDTDNTHVAGGILFFKSNRLLPDGNTQVELWRSDGTQTGTYLLTVLNWYNAKLMTDYNNTLIYSVDNELWRSDGTHAGTVLVKSIPSGSINSEPHYFTNINGTFFFLVTDNSETQLWKSDGTEVGTVQVATISSSNESIRYMTSVHGTLYFGKNNNPPGGLTSSELWKMSGTDASPVLVKEYYSNSNHIYINDLIGANDTLFIVLKSSPSDYSSHHYELWKSDGTVAGTNIVKAIELNQSINELTNINGTLFFTTNEFPLGQELWRSDGSEASTVLVKDIMPGSNDSYPQYLTNFNDNLVFSAEAPITGKEPYILDLTSPTSDVTFPSNDAIFAVGTNVEISGVASDYMVGLSGVEVSVDSGNSWEIATNTSLAGDWSSWSYNWITSSSGGITQILSRGIDLARNVEIPTEGPIVNVMSTHTLDVTIVGQGSVFIDSGGGTLCTDDCVQDYVEDTTVPLYINTAGNGYSFAGWSGDCSGTGGDCMLTMNTAKNVTATFLENVPNPVILEGSSGSFTTIQFVYDGITSGQIATIKVKEGLQSSENLMFDRDVTLRLEGGYDQIFTNIIGDTSFYGTLTIKDGTATISDLIIK